MAQIIKIDDEYYVEYWAQGLRFQKKGGKDLAHAQKLLDEIKASVPEKIEDVYTVRDDAFTHVAKAFKEYANTNLPAPTARRLIDALNHFINYIETDGESTRISQITPKRINDYYLHLKEVEAKRGVVKPKVVDLTLILLRIFFDWVISHGALNDNPTLHTKILNPNLFHYPICLTEEDITELLNQSDSNTWKLGVLIMVTTGLTAQEIRDLRAECFDLNRKVLTFSNRQWPVDLKLLEFKGLLSQSGRLFSPWDIEALHLIGKKRIVQNAFAKYAMERGASLIQLCGYLGCDDIIKVMGYTHFAKLQN